MGESNQCHAADTLPCERALVRTVDEGGWAPGHVWTDMEKTKSLASTGVQTLDCTAHKKSQYQLHYPGINFKYGLTSSSSVGPVANATDVLQPSRLIVLTLSAPRLFGRSHVRHEVPPCRQ